MVFLGTRLVQKPSHPGPPVGNPVIDFIESSLQSWNRRRDPFLNLEATVGECRGSLADHVDNLISGRNEAIVRMPGHPKPGKPYSVGISEGDGDNGRITAIRASDNPQNHTQIPDVARDGPELRQAVMDASVGDDVPVREEQGEKGTGPFFALFPFRVWNS